MQAQSKPDTFLEGSIHTLRHDTNNPDASQVSLFITPDHVSNLRVADGDAANVEWSLDQHRSAALQLDPSKASGCSRPLTELDDRRRASNPTSQTAIRPTFFYAIQDGWLKEDPENPAETREIAVP